MRVAHIVRTIRPEAGGPSTVLSELCDAERARGWETRVLVGDAILPDHGPDGHVSPLGLGDIARFRPEPGELPHVHGLWNPTTSAAMLRLRIGRTPYVLSPHGMLRPETIGSVKKRVWAALWERANVASATLLHAATEDEIEAARACGWRLPPVALIPHAVDCEFWTPAPDAVRERAVVFVGRLARIKRLELLIEAFALALEPVPDATLEIVGPDWEGLRGSLEALAAALHVSHRVRFHGMQPRVAVRALLQRAAAGALVSERESFGCSAAEAMACAVPVVMTRHVGIAPDAAAAGAGLVADDGAVAIAEQLAALLVDPERGSAIGARARAFVRERYSAAAVGRDMTDVYAWALGQGPRPGCVRA